MCGPAATAATAATCTLTGTCGPVVSRGLHHVVRHVLRNTRNTDASARLIHDSVISVSWRDGAHNSRRGVLVGRVPARCGHPPFYCTLRENPHPAHRTCEASWWAAATTADRGLCMCVRVRGALVGRVERWRARWTRIAVRETSPVNPLDSLHMAAWC